MTHIVALSLSGSSANMPPVGTLLGVGLLLLIFFRRKK